VQLGHCPTGRVGVIEGLGPTADGETGGVLERVLSVLGYAKNVAGDFGGYGEAEVLVQLGGVTVGDHRIDPSIDDRRDVRPMISYVLDREVACSQACSLHTRDLLHRTVTNLYRSVGSPP
jgi:hypothetical protein